MSGLESARLAIRDYIKWDGSPSWYRGIGFGDECVQVFIRDSDDEPEARRVVEAALREAGLDVRVEYKAGS